MILSWRKDPSGDWYADGENGRLYRYHTLAGLKVGGPNCSFEIPIIGHGHKDAFDFAAIKRHAQEYEDSKVHQTFAKPTPRATIKAEKQKAAKAQRRGTYRDVEIRDGMKCRACTRRVVKTFELRLNRLEHHHVNGRDVADAEGSWNICLLCKECHDERHVSRLLHIQGNANQLLRFERNGETWKA